MARMAQDVDLRALTPIAERVATEGEPYGPTIFHEGVTLSDGYTIGNISLPSLTRAYYIETLAVSCNKYAVMQVVLGFQLTQTTAQQVHRFIVRPDETVYVPIGKIFRPHQTSFFGANTSIGLATVRKVLDATPANAHVYVGSHGFQIYDDLNFTADKVMLVLGDSILNGTSGITRKINSMDWLTRSYFQAKGTDVRAINKSISGSTSTEHEQRRAAGVYDFPQVDYIHYQLGSNDAGSAIPASTSRTNLEAMIAWKQQRYPKATMIVWGSTPLENNTTEASLAAIRTAQAAAVTAAADPKILYCSLGAAFDRTNTANYSAQDTAGSRVHPSDAGHAAAYSVISGFLTAQNVRL